MKEGGRTLLARIRAVAPDVPLGVALDLHANVTPGMVAAADVIIGFKTYPHVDMAETGAHVARLVGRMLDEGLAPHQAWCHPPQLAHTLRMDTRVPGPMADLVAGPCEAAHAQLLARMRELQPRLEFARLEETLHHRVAVKQNQVVLRKRDGGARADSEREPHAQQEEDSFHDSQ